MTPWPSLSQLFRFDSLRPKTIVTASVHVCKSQQFFNILLFWRVISFILALSTCIINAAHKLNDHNEHWDFFLSFTNLCFMFLAVYFLVAASLSFGDWRKQRYAYFVSVPGGNSTTESLLFGGNIEDDDLEPDVPAPPMHKVFWVMFEIGFSLAIFIDILFWTLIYEGTLDALVIILHALNGALMVGELFFNSLEFVPAHVVFVWLVLLLYAIEAVIWHTVDGRWAYKFLDPSDKIAFAYYPILFISATVTFLIGYLLVKLRDRKKQSVPLLSIQETDQLF